jgi:hypothetical protein
MEKQDTASDNSTEIPFSRQKTQMVSRVLCTQQPCNPIAQDSEAMKRDHKLVSQMSTHK